MNRKVEIDPKLLKKIQVLQTPVIREVENEKSGRANFMQEAGKMVSTVTPQTNLRHNNWIKSIRSRFVFRRKEYSPMFSTLTTILMIVSLVLGGGGITVASAQSSQPDQLLYGVKLLSEDLRLDLTSDPQTQYEIALEFLNRRAEEIQTLLDEGDVPTSEVVSRYQNQIEQTIRLALNLPDDQAIQAMEQIQTRIQSQMEIMGQILANNSPDTEAVRSQIREMIQDKLQILDESLTEPDQLRDQIRQQDQLQDQDRTCTPSPQALGTQTKLETGNGNPWTTGTPIPESGYGPGPGPDATCTTCTPQSNDYDYNGSNASQESGQSSQSGKQSTTVPGGQNGNH